MSTEGPVFRTIYDDDEDDLDDDGQPEGKVLVAVIGPGPEVTEIVLHGPDPGESVTHRVPRPLTLAQARNQALNYAMDMWFDAVVLLSGPLPPWPLAAPLWAVAAADPDIAMVTGLESPSAGGARNWAAGQLVAEFGTEAIDIPAPGPECVLITIAAIRRIDIFDLKVPKGGEIDWALRARKAGLRVVAAPAVPLGGPATAPPEGMVLFRHPSFIKDQKAFWASGAVESVQARAANALVRAAARTIGYTVDVTSQPRPMITHDSLARVSIAPEPASTVDIRFAGLQSTVEVGEGDPPDLLELAFGRLPERVVVYDRGDVADRLSVWEFSGVPIDDRTAI
ncbi:MAG TPA: hypothetical protein VM942_02090 [Acidimicrobiales bacterium]|nr:hypothetical protein [Acidimicrobiales bacterium]